MKQQNGLTVLATVSSKNQITIPREIRHKLSISPKDILAFEIQENGNIILKKGANHNLWDIIKEQQEMYGAIEEDEFTWGDDVGKEVLDE